MSSVPVAPALGLLLRLKLRGAARRHWRRLRTPKGLLLTLLGAGVLVLWIGSLAFSIAGDARPLSGQAAELRVRFFGLIMLALSLSGALTNRGLYLPRNEIERLFSAPLSRSDLVRYRLLAGGLRALIGGVMLGLFGALRMPSPALAFAGILLAMQTLPVVNQLIAISMAGLERRAARALRAVGVLLLVTLLGALGTLAFTLSTGRLAGLPLLGPWLEGLIAEGGDLLANPVLARATLPFLPWGRMIGAQSGAAFGAWFALCLALHVVLIELCARLPVDFRERSLATSARAAKRVAHMRRGGGVAMAQAGAGSLRWRVPRLFGRGPGGAIAWRKSMGMARKAKGAFWIALVALLFITVFATLLDGPLEGAGANTPFWIAILGTVYLCSGLRFDFREELERMDVVRTWPLSPRRVFLAMLLPEVLLVSLLVGVTVLCNAFLSNTPLGHVLGVACCLPTLVFVWAAVDNIVFLFAPVRTVPGQDGFVQNAGRRMIQMAALTVMGGIPVATAAAAWLLTWRLAGASGALAYGLGYSSAFLVLACACAGLVGVGGAVLRRFDVARDRG